MISGIFAFLGSLFVIPALIVLGIVALIVSVLKQSRREAERQKRNTQQKQGYSVSVVSTTRRDGVVVDSHVIGVYGAGRDEAGGAGRGGRDGAGGGPGMAGGAGRGGCDGAGGGPGLAGCGALTAGAEPDMRRLLYPGELVSFEALARGGHDDPRGLIYAIHRFDTERTRPFYAAELNAGDFAGSAEDGKEAARLALLEKGLIASVAPEEELQIVFLKDQLAELLRERGLSDKGRKSTLAKRLADSGYELDRSAHREGLFRLTERGIEAVERRRNEKREAIRRAVHALCVPDHETVTAFCRSRQNGSGNALDAPGYEGAVAAYRAFDDTWGFVHTSGKRHTIFAHKDIPIRQFVFLENYPMREVNNSEEFRTALRACLLAGLMRGCQERMELAEDFLDICGEAIDCPGVVGMYELDRRDQMERDIREAMLRNVGSDKRYELEYYISRLLYLSRRSG